VTSRFRSTLIVAGLALSSTLAGCSDSFNAGPMSYVENSRLTTDLKSPTLQGKVRQALSGLYGDDPRHIRVPEGSGLPGGGIYLANYLQPSEKAPETTLRIFDQGTDPAGKPSEYPQPGGYGLYRQHCLHCHGVTGAGDGPTSAFLYPRPRDYRKGLFKFTSTPTGVKPTREDLRKTIKYGLHGTSMPAFEALMSGPETEQVIDYVIFLSMRGETELGLIDEAMIADEKDPQALAPDVVADVAKAVFNKWKAAESQVLDPPIPRTPPTRESILRGKDLFLGLNKTGNKVDCTSCHGPQAIGNGPSFVKQEIFNAVVFNGNLPKSFELSSGELEILQALTTLGSGGERHGSSSEKSEPENPQPPTFQNLVAALRKSLQVSDADDPAALKAKLGFRDDPEGLLTSFDQIVERQVSDLEAKTLVSHGLGFGSSYYHATIDAKTGKLWNDSLDDWRNPLRPANLNRGVYKGGRRPIDLYWRIAKGINGAKMPAHFPTIEPERIWDLVNFVLELPSEPTLLEGATLPAAPPASAPKVAVRR
jgi:mono/diheme cytochrome c family protein